MEDTHTSKGSMHAAPPPATHGSSASGKPTGHEPEHHGKDASGKDAPHVEPATLTTLPAPPSISGPQGQAYYAETTFALNVLLSDGKNVVSRQGTAAANIGVLARGTVVNFNATTHAIAATDGNPAGTVPPNAILAQQYDTTVVPIPPAEVYVSGKFKYDAITWGPTGTYSQSQQAECLRQWGLLVETVMDTTGKLVPL